MYESTGAVPASYAGNTIAPGTVPHLGKQPLTQEQIEILIAEGNKAEWRISDTDLLKARCTHKDKQGKLTLIERDDGKVKCTICGEEFHLLSDDLTAIQKHVDYVIDALQTTKTIYLDVPDQLAEGYFQTIPMLKKLAVLYRKAADNMAQHNTSYTSAVYGTTFNADPGAWSMMNSIMAGNNGFYPSNVPVPGQYNAQGQFVPAQPAMNQMQYAINPMTGTPMPIMAQPQVVQPAQQPAPQVSVPPVAQPQVVQPTQSQQVTQTKTFNV